MDAATQAEIDRQVAARLAALQPQPQPGFAPPQQGFAPPAQQGFIQPAGGMPAASAQAVLVPVELTGPDGSKVTMYLQFPGSFAANYQAMSGLVQTLMNQGYPVRVFTPKQQGWGNGNGNGGGWNGRRGGYR